MTQAAHVPGITTPKARFNVFPSSLFLLNKSKSTNPTTVGGRTIGSVRILSATAFFPDGSRITRAAANNPVKNVIKVAAIPVFSVTHNGVQALALEK